VIFGRSLIPAALLMKFGIRTIWRSFARGLQWLFVLGTVCVFALPFPAVVIPQSASEKDLSEPFPCMHRACGCRSAEQCWKSCCCFSNREKVAWARANQVRLPLFVHRAADKEVSTTVLQSKAKSSCCDRGHNSTRPEVTVECSSASPDETPAVTQVEPSRRDSSRWITLKDVSECQGNAVFWLTISAFALPHSAAIQCCGSLPPEILEFPRALPACVFRTPPSPPPDLCVRGNAV